MNEEYVEPKGRIERSWIVVDVDPRNPQDAHLVFRILGANYGTVPLALLIDRNRVSSIERRDRSGVREVDTAEPSRLLLQPGGGAPRCLAARGGQLAIRSG